MSVKVFAFGSNMCLARFRKYGVSPEATGEAARLPGHRLVFNKLSNDSSGKANVVADLGSEVWGVVYSLPDEHITVLDSGEGRGYERKPMRVHLADGSEVDDVQVYIAVSPSADPNLRPYTWYKQFLLEGAREHGLPLSYVEKIEAVLSVEDSDQVRNKTNRKIINP